MYLSSCRRKYAAALPNSLTIAPRPPSPPKIPLSSSAVPLSLSKRPRLSSSVETPVPAVRRSFEATSPVVFSPVRLLGVPTPARITHVITEAEFIRFQREWYERHEATLHRSTEPLHFQQLLSQIGRKLPRFTTGNITFDGKTWTLAHALARGKFGVAVLLEQQSSNRRGQPPRMVMKVDRDHFSVHWEATVHRLVSCCAVHHC